MGRSRSRSPGRSRNSRHRSSRYRTRSRSPHRSRDREHKRVRDHKHRRRSRSRSPIARLQSSPSTSGTITMETPVTNSVGALLLNSTATSNGDTLVGTILPPEVKKDLCVKDWDPNQMTGAALKWVTDQVAEQINARTQELDAVVRERVAKAKVELEARLRAQIEQEWKEEIEATRKREQDSLTRCQNMESSLAEKLREVEEEKTKLSEERLQMLETKAKLENERNSLKDELEKLKKNEQQSILNKGGFQRAPIRITFGGK